jgi:hypothetical protein
MPGAVRGTKRRRQIVGLEVDHTFRKPIFLGDYAADEL